MDISEIRWNEPARAKILDDADRVLREAVVAVAAEHPSDATEAYEGLNGRLKTRFIDYEPGPDVQKYADAIVAGDFDDAASIEVNDG